MREHVMQERPQPPSGAPDDPPAPRWKREGPALLRMLQVQLTGHRRLRDSMARTREAIRTADLESLAAACQETQETTGHLNTIEQQRLALVQRMARDVGVADGETLVLDDIAAECDDTVGATMRETATALAVEVRHVRQESSVITKAATALSRHTAGIMQTVHATLSRVGVYERRGRIAIGAQTDYCIDLKT